MTRTMYDSTTAADIPLGVQMVAGYVDLWAPADWQRWPASVRKVRISRYATVNDGHVLDVGEGVPNDAAPRWVTMRRLRGVDASVYTNLDNWQACRAAFDAAGVPQPHWWIAAYSQPPGSIDGAVAHQYANPTQTGHHYDLSAVADYWPGVDPAPPQPPAPADMGDEVMLIQVSDYAEHPYYLVGAAGRRWITDPDELAAWQRAGIHFEQMTAAQIGGIPTIPGTPTHP